ncbi:MAG: nitrate reductase [Gemmatales bacterium]|nr:nitrate reductase [Gemmatales bacterium]MDW8223299.1 nitrate reductase [Gemmatales bacterium]
MNVLGEAICPYCGVGCRLRVEGQPGRPERIRGVEDAPANLGRICAKGATLHEAIHTPDRLMVPLLRTRREEEFRPVSWELALSYLAGRVREILTDFGPNALAFYGSGQLDTETAYLACKLFKGFFGTNNTDSNSRLCMAAAVAGYRTSLGSDGPPCCYEDIDHADVIFIIGSNMAECHPVTFDRVRAAKRRHPQLTIIVADPRCTATAREADLYLPVKPGGDIALLNALGRMLLELGAADNDFIRNHTNGFAEYRQFLLEQDIPELCRVAGIAESVLHEVAQRLARSSGFLSFYCMGLNQSTVGMWKNNSLINLHLLTGQIGKVGAGPFSLTGQPNAMGGREAGLLCHQLPGYRFVESPEHRQELETFWRRPVGSIAAQPGLTAVEMFRALEKGQLQAIWIAATNPQVSLPDLHQVRRALHKAQLVVVQDAYHPTETTRWAHVVLPAAQWGEKEWTSTSSERLVSYSPKLFDPPGLARPDWQILASFARTFGLDGFSYGSAAEVWEEFRQLTRGRPCDMFGITAGRLRRERHVYWPCPDESHPGSPRRYLDRVFPTANGRANFLPRDHREPRELPDHEFPFVLTTGRLYAHWHTLTRTGKCRKLVRREPGPFVEISAQDAARLGLREGDLVLLSSRRGAIRLPARITSTIAPGMVFVPFHWGDLHQPENATNYLTISALGRVAKQPELKFCAVNVEKVRLASHSSASPENLVHAPR